ncbi:hypothetical protein EI94DRAFT_1527230, partial [Lactarius quietus]
SSLSLVFPSNPIHSETVRAATSVFCQEMLRPSQSAGLEEEEYHMLALARLEHVWGKSGASTKGSVNHGGMGSSANMAGEERARKMFTAVLRD